MERQRLAENEKKLKYKGAKPSKILREFEVKKPSEIKNMIDRYAKDTKEKMKKLTTEKAKLNKVDAFKNKLASYENDMKQKNIEHYTEVVEELTKYALK